MSSTGSPFSTSSWPSPPPSDRPVDGEDEGGPSAPAAVDRAVVPLLFPPSPPSGLHSSRLRRRRRTPSGDDDISVVCERAHRLHGTSLVIEASLLLRLGPSTSATACAVFHRFFHRRSLAEFDVWSIAAGCILIACKIEEEEVSGAGRALMRETVAVYHHLFRRRRLRVGHAASDDPVPTTGARSPLASLDESVRRNLLRSHVPTRASAAVHGSVACAIWTRAVRTAEAEILRETGFVLHWIPDMHPHKFLLYMIRMLKLGSSAAQAAWEYCNDSTRLDLGTRFGGEVIACAAIHLAAPGSEAWYVPFVGNRGVDVASVCNALLALHDERVTGPANMQAFLPSLVEGGAFNDPGSELWKMLDAVEMTA